MREHVPADLVETDAEFVAAHGTSVPADLPPKPLTGKAAAMRDLLAGYRGPTWVTNVIDEGPGALPAADVVWASPPLYNHLSLASQARPARVRRLSDATAARIETALNHWATPLTCYGVDYHYSDPAAGVFGGGLPLVSKCCTELATATIISDTGHPLHYCTTHAERHRAAKAYQAVQAALLGAEQER